MLAIVGPGDEVIVLEPCYDSYVPNIELSGGTVVRVALTAGSFRPDFASIAAAISTRAELRMGGYAGMGLAVVDHVLVDLIGDQHNLGRRQQLGQYIQVVPGPDRGAGVVRGVDDDRPGARADGGGD